MSMAQNVLVFIATKFALFCMFSQFSAIKPVHQRTTVFRVVMLRRCSFHCQVIHRTYTEDSMI